MNTTNRWRTLLVAGLMFACTTACAQEIAPNLPSPAQHYLQSAQPLLLAENDKEMTAKRNPVATSPAAQAEFDEPWLTGSNAHMVMGLGSVALAVAAMFTSPEEHSTPRDRNGTHATLAKTAAGLAVGAVASGLIFHWDDFHMEDGWTDPDNLHFLLGTAGAAVMTYAVIKSASSSTKVSHAGLAEAGALGMALAIKINW